MKEIIQTENYLLIVSDEERGQPGYNYNFGLNKIDKLSLPYLSHSTESNCCQKITAHLPLNNAPILEGVPLLPELKIENNIELKLGKLHHHLQDIKDYEGVKQIQEIIVTKSLYTEDDLRNALLECWNTARSDLFVGFPKASNNKQWEVFTKIIQFLKQSKYPKFFISEVDIKFGYGVKSDGSSTGEIRHKTTINPHGQTVLIGTYKYK